MGARRMSPATLAQSGLVPWSLAGILRVLDAGEHYEKRPPEKKPGPVGEYLTYFLATDLRNQGVPGPECFCHALRWWEIGDFLKRHHESLVSAGLVRIVGENGEHEISEDLLEELATSPFEGERTWDSGEVVPTFDLASIVQRALERDAQDGS